jgi:lipoprotein-anchoring transpeptidase ErfK/SrfK
MGLPSLFKISLMLVCFGSAGMLFSAARPEPQPKPIAAKPNKSIWAEAIIPLPSLKSVSPLLAIKPEVKQASPVSPVLKKAIASVSSRLVVDLSDAKVYNYWGNQLIATYAVAVGQPGWETPVGTFKIQQKLRNPVWQQPITGDLIRTGPDNPLGSRWIGFWSDGRHHIGFHGTNKEQLVGQPVSHGCLRMRNPDIQALYEQVTLGTVVIVRN